jgi:molecular chaperone DnaJ
MAGQDWFEKDFYAVLGVDSDATADEVKKAYRKLARQHHPDANAGDPAAERRFKEIGEAYQVLSDPEQRQQYDAVRAMARGGARFTAGGPNGSPGGFEDLLGGLFGNTAGGAGRRNVRFTTAPGGAGPNLEDLFGMFGPAAGPMGAPGGMGGMGGAGGMGGMGAPRGQDLVAETTLTFRQALEGALLNLRVEDPATGVRTVTARVPAGVRDGQKVRLRGKGHPGGPGIPDGDLVVTVHVQPHPVFSLDGLDVRVTVPVTFPEAVLGADVQVPTPDGGTVRLRVPAGTPSGRTLRVKGRGAQPHQPGKKPGDLLVTVQIAVPQRVDSDARAAVEAFAAATEGEDPRADLLARSRGETTGVGDVR